MAKARRPGPTAGGARVRTKVTLTHPPAIAGTFDRGARLSVTRIPRRCGDVTFGSGRRGETAHHAGAQPPFSLPRTSPQRLRSIRTPTRTSGGRTARFAKRFAITQVW
jgi:hypothetical protein